MLPATRRRRGRRRLWPSVWPHSENRRQKEKAFPSCDERTGLEEPHSTVIILEEAATESTRCCSTIVSSAAGDDPVSDAFVAARQPANA